MSSLGACLVTGGSGYLGRRLARELLLRGNPTRVFDRRGEDGARSADGVLTVRGDVRSRSDLRRACAGVDTVFHCAGVIPLVRFAPRRERDECWAINVDGCRNVLDEAGRAGARRFVYTSSTNVALGAAPPARGMAASYVSRPRDLYTATKITAEKMVLAANDPQGLLTCALRPGGIWGAEDSRIVGRLVLELRRGGLRWRIGDPRARSDNTYVQNAVDGHIAAATRLVPGSPACGQAYDVTDGHPASVLEFLEPLIVGLGLSLPERRFPVAPIHAAAWIGEALHAFAGVPRPRFTTGELTRFYRSDAVSLDRTRADLGWSPPIPPEEAYAATLDWCRAALADSRSLPPIAPRGRPRIAPVGSHQSVDRPHPFWWIALPGGMAVLAALALAPSLHEAWSRHVTTWTPRWLLLVVLAVATATHVVKGLRAARLASRAGLDRASAWGWQTFLLGFASMRLLRRRIARSARGGAA